MVTAVLLGIALLIPPGASANIFSHGGPVQASPHVYEIYWGSNWNQEPAAGERGRLGTLYNELSGSSWQGILTQYWAPNGFVSPTVTAASYTDSAHGGAPQAVTNAKIATEISEVAAVTGWPQTPDVNNQFVLLMAPGTTYEMPSTNFCGFHDATSAKVVYAVVDWGTRNNCSMTVTAGHEYAEAVTDPYPHPFPQPFEKLHGWGEPEEGQTEIADICGGFERGFLPGGIEVPAIYDNSVSHCSNSHSNPPQIPPEMLTEGATGITASKAVLHGTIHPNNLNIKSYFFKYGPSGCALTFCGESSHNDWGKGQNTGSVSQELTGLQPGTKYQYQLWAEAKVTGIEGPAGEWHEFTTVGPPTAKTTQASDIHAGAATLSGTVNPNGAPTKYSAEYVLEEEFNKHGFENATVVPGGELPAGNSPVEVSVPASGLKPSPPQGLTGYYFRIAATNEGGAGYGNAKWFHTWSINAISGSATSVSNSEAMLNGIVDPDGVPTTYQFQYDTVGGRFASSVPISPESVGGGLDDVEVRQALSGLKPSTKYYFRVVGTDAWGGVFKGDEKNFTTAGSCKGAESKCEWKAQSSVDLSRSEHSLAGVSCASASMCMGVGNDALAGTGNAQLWDGTKWANKLTLGQSTAGISCPATNWCMVVGIGKNVPKGFLLKEEASTWSLETTTPPVPSGGSKAALKSVSCISSTACTAVGSYYVESEAKYKTLIERWDGTSWSAQISPNPASGSAESAMLAVSCASSTSCLTTGTANNAPFAASWNGTKWTTQTIPAPSPSVEATLTGISCTSSTACTAVGTNKESSAKGFYKKSLAERWNGTSWSIQTVPNPSEALGVVKLAAVSCTSSTTCTAVGLYAPLAGENPLEQRTLAESWNGTSWSVQVSPNSAQKVNALSAVSCTSSTACTAVGAAQPGQWAEAGSNNENQASLAERLSGGEWKAQETPGQSRSSYSLSSVSCAPTSASLCWAVGADSYTGTGVGELWNGTQWTKQFGFVTSTADVSCPSATWCMVVGIGKSEAPRAWNLREEGSTWGGFGEGLPVPSGGSRATPFAVSCSSTVSCTAVGYYHSDTENVNKPLVEHWNGTGWSLQTAPSPPVGSAGNAMLDVSCVSSTSCLTVGTANNATFAESWNGTAWTALTPPSPGTAESTLEGVSCALATSCKAVGSYRETGKGQYKKPLAVRWNGTEWALLTTPSPGEAKGDVTLKSVSCASPTYCTAVGQYSPEASSAPLETRSLAEYWDGNAWAVQSSPNSTQKQNALSGVSCSSSIACTAVGSSAPEPFASLNQAALVARYE